LGSCTNEVVHRDATFRVLAGEVRNEAEVMADDGVASFDVTSERPLTEIV
jgi:hypothetical protein